MEKARILIVEDEAIIAMEIESQLQSLGYKVTSIVDTGEKAIEKAEEDKPDLILMDIRIKSEVDGIDTAELIRNRYGIPVIFSTAYLDEKRIDRAKITMPFGYVLKPIQERDLKVTIEMALYVSKVDVERKEAENLLKESESKWRAIAENSPAHVMLLNKELEIQFINRTVPDLSKEEVIGKSIMDFTPSTYQKVSAGCCKRVLQTGKSEKYITQYATREGGINFFEVSIGPVLEDEKVVALISSSIDITERKQAEEMLRESEEKYRTLIKNIPGVSYRCECDENWTMRFISSEVEVLTGYPVSDFVDNNLRTWASVILPDDKEGAEALATEKISNQEPYSIEFRIIGKNGNIRWVHEKGQGIFNKEGKPLFLDGVIVDITDRKQAEERIKANLKEKETLLQEIHHRVKNNMTVISSLLSLQAGKVDNDQAKEALMDSQNRVRSISAIHETLYQSDNLSTVDMQTYLSNLAGAVAQNYSTVGRVNLKIEAKNILIGAKQASPVGLIVNELITNSFKYAFPDIQEGEIKINLQQEENQIELEYFDNGIGIPVDFDWKSTKSMGSLLLTCTNRNENPNDSLYLSCGKSSSIGYPVM
jgi:PAS domain S-box-containing protein